MQIIILPKLMSIYNYNAINNSIYLFTYKCMFVILLLFIRIPIYTQLFSNTLMVHALNILNVILTHV